MKTKLLAASVLLLPACLQAQTVTKVIRVKGNPNELASLVCNAQLNCKPSPALQAVVLQGRSEDVSQAEQSIVNLDSLAAAGDTRGTKSVETTLYVVAGSQEGIPGAQEITAEPLLSVVKQLRPLFSYQHYQSLSSLMIRSVDGSPGASEGIMPTVKTDPSINTPAHYRLTYESAQSSNDRAALIRFKRLQFNVQIPYVSGRLESKAKDGAAIPYASVQYQQTNVNVSSDVDVRENQKAVVGKANVSDSDTCFFIVVSARLVP